MHRNRQERRLQKVDECRTESEAFFEPYLSALCLSRGWQCKASHPIGPYFADFAILEQKIAVEIDGSFHDSMYKIPKDIKRNSHFRTQGWVTFRFRNEEAVGNPDACISRILEFLQYNLILPTHANR